MLLNSMNLLGRKAFSRGPLVQRMSMCEKDQNLPWGYDLFPDPFVLPAGYYGPPGGYCDVNCCDLQYGRGTSHSDEAQLHSSALTYDVYNPSGEIAYLERKRLQLKVEFHMLEKDLHIGSIAQHSNTNTKHHITGANAKVDKNPGTQRLGLRFKQNWDEVETF